MSERTLRRLAAVLVIALAVWGALAVTHRVREGRPSRFTLPRIDTARVDTVSLTKHGDSALLVRGTHGAWTVNAHPADTARVADLLRALADTSAWGETAAESPQSYAGLGVDADSGLHVRVRGHGALLLDVITGKRTSDGGVYLRLDTNATAGSDHSGEPDRRVYALHGNGLADPFTRSSDDWRDRTISRVTPDSVFSADVHHGASTFSLRRDGAHWTIADAGAADSGAVASWLESFRTLSASGFATPAQADSAHFDKPKASVSLHGKAGAVLLALSFDSTAAAAWARTAPAGPVFKIDSWQLGQLAPPESTLKAKKKP